MRMTKLNAQAALCSAFLFLQVVSTSSRFCRGGNLAADIVCDAAKGNTKQRGWCSSARTTRRLPTAPPEVCARNLQP
jgi:hypothetical protein